MTDRAAENPLSARSDLTTEQAVRVPASLGRGKSGGGHGISVTVVERVHALELAGVLNDLPSSTDDESEESPPFPWHGRRRCNPAEAKDGLRLGAFLKGTHEPVKSVLWGPASDAALGDEMPLVYKYSSEASARAGEACTCHAPTSPRGREVTVHHPRPAGREAGSRGGPPTGGRGAVRRFGRLPRQLLAGARRISRAG